MREHFFLQEKFTKSEVRLVLLLLLTHLRTTERSFPACTRLYLSSPNKAYETDFRPRSVTPMLLRVGVGENTTYGSICVKRNQLRVHAAPSVAKMLTSSC